MIFLIEYDRQKEKMVVFEKYKNSERVKAENKRLDIELNLNRRNIRHEVVLLEAVTENALKQTHRRYFNSLKISLRDITSDRSTN